MNRLYIPIETKVREFLPKTLLGCWAAQSGFEVVIGHNEGIYRCLRTMGRGIYLGYGATNLHVRLYKEIRGYGHRVTAWCEEGLSILDKDDYARFRIDPVLPQYADLFFAWGNFQAEAVKGRLLHKPDMVVLSGNPRIDILRPPFSRVFDEEVDGISAKYAPFILVNTNFGISNNFFRPDFVFEKLMARKRAEDPDHELFIKDWIEHNRFSYLEFTRAVEELCARFPEHQVVVRPHPSENHDNWRQALAGRKNAHVIHQGSAIPWMLAAEILIHNACTTGVECYFLGKKPISYRPKDSDLFEPRLPKLVSSPAFSLEELMALTAARLNGARAAGESASEKIEHSDEIRDFVSHIDGTYACEMIVEELLKLAGNPDDGGRGRPGALHNRLLSTYRDLRFLAGRLYRRMTVGTDREDEYLSQKFPGIALAEVAYAVEKFQASSGRFEKVSARPLPGVDSCFILTG